MGCIVSVKMVGEYRPKWNLLKNVIMENGYVAGSFIGQRIQTLKSFSIDGLQITDTTAIFRI